MGKITDITRQKRNKTRVNIFIDGEFVCGLDETAVAAARIKIGDEVTGPQFKALVEDSELNSAFDRSVGYLSFGLRSRREIEKYLLDKQYSRDVVDKTLEKLDYYRYIDDYGYAQSYIKSKSKKYGSFKLSDELRKKGISAEIIDELLDEGGDDGAVAVAQKYLASHKTADKLKLKRFLAGRGFSWDSISAAVSKLNEQGAFDASDSDGEYYD